MSSWLIALVGLVYAYIAVEQIVRGSPQMGMIFGGYALSNVGFYFLAK